MPSIVFEEIGLDERRVLLRAFGYDIEGGFIIDQTGARVRSQEQPLQGINIKNVMLTKGSLNVLDATPTSISKFIREKIENAE